MRGKKLICLCALLLLALPAPAATLASRAAELVNVLNARSAQIPAQNPSPTQKKEKTAIVKALASLNAEAADIAVSLKNAGKVVKALDQVYPPADSIGDVEKGLLDVLAQDVVSRSGPLAISVAKMPAGKPRTKAVTLLGDIERIVTDSYNAPVRADRVKLLASAVKSQAKVEKAAAGSGVGGKVTTTAFDTDLGDEHLHLPIAVGPSNYTVTCTPGDLVSGEGGQVDFLIDAPAEGGGRHQLTLAAQNPGPGERSLDLVASRYQRVPDMAAPLPVTAGKIVFTTWDAVNGKVAGTMNVTFSDGTTTVELTNGKFSTTTLVR